MTGFLCRCPSCGREERTGDNPLRDGWPKCHGYTMTLIDSEAFTSAIDRQMGEIFTPVAALRAGHSQHAEDGL